MMSEDRSVTSQGWFMLYLGRVMGQEQILFEKARAIIDQHDKVRGGKADPTSVDVQAGLAELTELVKQHLNNSASMFARCEVWRLDWRQEHGQTPELPKEKP
jgi:hypothetical protein